MSLSSLQGYLDAVDGDMASPACRATMALVDDDDEVDACVGVPFGR